MALDINAVRRALGIKKLDLYGRSYAAVDVQSYAARFPRHVRSAVPDSPMVPEALNAPGSEFDDFRTDIARTVPRVADLLCARSASCSAERRTARGDLAWLARRLRHRALEGTGYDAQGIPHQVRVTEGFLAWIILQDQDSNFTSLSEIGAAADALRAGDRGAAAAAGGRERRRQRRQRRRGRPDLLLGGRQFRARLHRPRFFVGRGRPDLDPAAAVAGSTKRTPPGSVRALLRGGLAGPADQPRSPRSVHRLARSPAPGAAADPAGREASRAAYPRWCWPATWISASRDRRRTQSPLTRLWPHSDYVELANSGHLAADGARADCAVPIMMHFIAKLEPGDTGCAPNADAVSFPGVGRFALTAKHARPARIAPGSQDRSRKLDRRVATVATGAITDALRRAILQPDPSNGLGLRGGTFDAPSFDDAGATVELHGARFAQGRRGHRHGQVSVSDAVHRREGESRRSLRRGRHPPRDRGVVRLRRPGHRAPGTGLPRRQAGGAAGPSDVS